MTGNQFGDLVVIVLPIVVTAPGPAFVGQREAGKADPSTDPREVLRQFADNLTRRKCRLATIRGRSAVACRDVCQGKIQARDDHVGRNGGHAVPVP